MKRLSLQYILEEVNWDEHNKFVKFLKSLSPEERHSLLTNNRVVAMIKSLVPHNEYDEEEEDVVRPVAQRLTHGLMPNK